MNERVPKGDACLSSLPQATWGRSSRDSEGVYMGMGHEVGDFKLQDPPASLMWHLRVVGFGGKWHLQIHRILWGVT